MCQRKTAFLAAEKERRTDEKQKARRENAEMKVKSRSNCDRERKKYTGPGGEGKRETQFVS